MPAFGEVDKRVAALSVAGCLEMVTALPGIANDQRLVWDAGEEGAGLDEGAEKLHLTAARAL